MEKPSVYSRKKKEIYYVFHRDSIGKLIDREKVELSIFLLLEIYNIVDEYIWN